MKQLNRFLTLMLTVLCLNPSIAMTQIYPIKPVRIVVPFAPGGTTDVVARVLAQKLIEAWQQPVVVENRGGAGGNVGAALVAKATPDGYTILYTIHSLAISQSLYRNLPFDGAKDFTPVTQLMSSYLVLVANSMVPANSLKELIDLAKSKPRSLSYGTGGVGTPGHLAMELLKILAGVDILHVPYKGDAPANAARLSGEVQLGFSPLAGTAPLAKAGKLKILATTAGKRSAAIPDVPTVAEAGLLGFEVTGWVGLFLPAHAPRDVVSRVYADAAKAVFHPDIRDRAPSWGYEPVGSPPEEFAAKFQSDIAMYARVIKEANVPVEN